MTQTSGKIPWTDHKPQTRLFVEDKYVGAHPSTKRISKPLEKRGNIIIGYYFGNGLNFFTMVYHMFKNILFNLNIISGLS